MTFPFPRPLTMAKNPTEVWSDTLPNDATSQTSREWRFVTPDLTSDGYWVRVRMQAASAATFAPDFVSLGIWSGSGYVTTATPTQLFFSGAAGFSISNGATITSDWARLRVTTSNKLVLIYDHGASNGNPAAKNTGGNLTGNSAVYTGSYQAYDQATPTGTYNDGGTTLIGFNLVQVQ